MIEERIAELPRDTQRHIRDKYEAKKLNMGTAWFLCIIGWHYAHTGKRGPFFLYVLVCFIPYVCIGGFIRWILQLVNLKREIKEKNDEILEEIYMRYKNA